MATLLMLAIVAAVSWFAPTSTAAFLINIAGFFIGVVGILFDLALNFFVVGFSENVYTPVADTIGNVIWAAFRDMANILIIGMFTLIAVSVILGVQSLNAKRMVARVLIIAVLINFSLFFARTIIEISNFIANQFYTAMALDNEKNTKSTAGGTTFEQITNFASKAGISGQFINLLGLRSAFDAQQTTNNVYKEAGKSVVTAVIYGFTTALLLLAVSLVLGYAAILLIARTALLLFLLVTSSLAFAAFLIPKWGENIWNTWWDTLLRSAFFAPLLMIMLWATMTLSYALVEGVAKKQGKPASFDQLFSNTESGSGVVALLVFLLILAMLYGSIRFASSFANKMTGYAQLKWGLGAALVGGAGTGGFLMRQGLGRFDALASRINSYRASAAMAAHDRELAKEHPDLKRIETLKKKYEFHKAKQLESDKYSRQTYQLTQNKQFQSLIKGLGAGKLVGDKAKSVIDRREETAKKAAKDAREGVGSKDSFEKLIRENRRVEEQRFKKDHENAENIVKEVRKSAETAKQQYSTQYAQARKDLREATEAKLKHQNDTTITDETEREARMRAEDAKIANARDRLKNFRDRDEAIDSEVKAAEQQRKVTLEALQDFEKGIKKAVDSAVEIDLKAAENRAVASVGGGLSAQEVRAQFKKLTAKDKKDGGIIKAIQEQIKASSGGEKPPAPKADDH